MSSVSSTFLSLSDSHVYYYIVNEMEYFSATSGKVKDTREAEMPQWQHQPLPPKYKLWQGIFSVFPGGEHLDSESEFPEPFRRAAILLQDCSKV